MKSIPNTLRLRELKETSRLTVQRELHVTRFMIDRLGFEAELNGHTGCVNCLEWNSEGNILASASDDVQVNLWDPFQHRLLKTIRTGHQGNIFSVKFMPFSGDQTILTGAADHKVRVHDLALDEPKMVCSCHSSRVKRLAIAPNNANLFWSASEDGTILQYDLRLPHKCSSKSSASLLVNLNNHLGYGAEAKCLAVNPVQEELLAVGANDPYVRLYDRRMITTTHVPFRTSTMFRGEKLGLLSERAGEGDENETIPRKAVRYYAPGHLPSVVPKSRNLPTSPSPVSTYLTFSADGNELLVNLGGEQIYLFDVHLNRKSFSFMVPRQERSSANGCSHFSEKDLQDKISKLKESANEQFWNKSYSKAINIYNEAIALNPKMAVLFANRAAAHMKRKWEGDDYAAYRDCTIALALDPSYSKAHFRLIQCLIALHKPDLARQSLQRFAELFPREIQTATYKHLLKNIESDAEMIKKAGVAENKKDMDLSEDEENYVPRPREISEMEKIWRYESSDYKLFFCGHCNTTTDIKEANFFGSKAQFILAGSDDGSFFIWDRNTTNILRAFKGDSSIVNCLQPHPFICLLATSGIENCVRLWSPKPENYGEIRAVKEVVLAAALNQKRMRADPFEVMLMNMTNRTLQSSDDSDEPPVTCRQS